MIHSYQSLLINYSVIMIYEDFKKVLQSSETVEVEFKSAKGGLPGSLWETYSSFGNTQGGQIILGVKEKGHRFVLDGLSKDSVLDYKKRLFDCLNNRQKVSVNIMKDEDAHELETSEGWVLIVDVPRAGLRFRPIYINNNPDEVYKRDYEGDYLCTPDEVRRMYAEANIFESPQDARILNGFSFDEDIDEESFREYRQLFANLQPTHPWASLPPMDLMRKLGGIRKDRRTGVEGLTLAGMLMFGKVSSITDVDCCPAYFPDYREYMSLDPNDRWTNRICPDGRWECNLFQFYRRVYNRMSDTLPKPFALKSGVRVEESPLHVALREGFANSLIHCDYTMNANVVVMNYKSKFVFTNPGSLLVTLNQYFRGGDSVCRNKSLQQMFMLIGSAEKAGSGADKIWTGWRQGNFRNPSIEECNGRVTLELPLVNILSEEVLSELMDAFGEKVKLLQHEKLLVLAACVSDGYVSNYRLQFVLDQHPADITLLLKELCEDGYLMASGIGKGTKYSLNVASNVLDEEIDTDADVADAHEASDAEDGENIASKVSGNVASNVWDEDGVSKRTRQLYHAIRESCPDFLPLTEIALKVNRKLRYLKNNVIPEMVSMGLLERKYPNVPSHPDQQYRCAREE